MRHGSAVLGLTLLHCTLQLPRDPSMDAWVEEQRLTFVDCGTSTCDLDDPETIAARDCIAEAEAACAPARVVSLELEDVVREANVFVVPSEAGCELHVFVGSRGSRHLECGRMDLDAECITFGSCL